jgi:hypothetical protein
LPACPLYGHGYHFAVQADLGRTSVAPSGANNDVEHRFVCRHQVGPEGALNMMGFPAACV